MKRAVERIPRMNCILVKYFGIYMWKYMGDNFGESQITKISEKLRTEADVVNYIQKINNQIMPRDRPLWEFRLLEDYTKTTSVLVCRLSHGFTDGAGLVGLLSGINDEEFKVSSSKEYPTVKWYIQALIAIISFFVFLPGTIEMKTFKPDKNSKRINEMNKQQNIVKQDEYNVSKEISFEKVRKVYKSYGDKYTFNDYMFGVLSKSLAQWYKKHGIKDVETINGFMPISMKAPPDSIDSLVIDNKMLSVILPLKITDNIGEAMSSLKPIIKRFTTPMFLLSTQYMSYLLPILPEALVRAIMDDLIGNGTFILTNVPFSKNTWYICNKEVYRFAAFVNTIEKVKFVILIFSYKDTFRINLSAKSTLKHDVSDLLSLIEENIDEEINKLTK